MHHNYSYFYEIDNMEYRHAYCAHCWREFSYHYPSKDVWLEEQPIVCEECRWIVNQDTYKDFINALRVEFKSYSGKVNSENYGIEVFNILLHKYEELLKNDEEKLMVFYMTMHPFVGLYHGRYDDSPLSDVIQEKIDQYFKKKSSS